MLACARGEAGIMNQSETAQGRRLVAPFRSQKYTLAYRPSLPGPLSFRNPIDTFVFLPGARLGGFEGRNQGDAISVIDLAYAECPSLPQFAREPVHVLS